MCSAFSSCAGDGQGIAVGNGAKVLVRVGHPPQHFVGGVQQHRCVKRLAEFGSDGHVVVVPVRAHHRDDMTATDGLDDRCGIVSGIEHHDIGIVADEPDVVVDFPTATVEFERSVRDYLVDHKTTTERSTLPPCILWNASSMSPSAMRSETNLSSGSRPCRCRSIRVGKSRSGRQSPYQDDFNEPPREKKSTSGMSRRMSGVGTPTRTTVPARSRA